MQDADGAWVLPEPAGDWFPSDSSMLGEYLAAARAMREPAAVMPQADFEAHMLALSDGKTAEELTIDTFPDVLAKDAALGKASCAIRRRKRRSAARRIWSKTCGTAMAKMSPIRRISR